MKGHSPCGLSITGDIKIYPCHVIKRLQLHYPQWRNALWTSIRSCFYCPNLITIIFLQLEMKRFVKVTWFWGNGVTTTWRRIQNGTLWMRFTFCPNLMFLAYPWLKIYRFSRFSSFSNSKLIFNLLTLGKSKLTLHIYFH